MQLQGNFTNLARKLGRRGLDCERRATGICAKDALARMNDSGWRRSDRSERRGRRKDGVKWRTANWKVRERGRKRAI